MARLADRVALIVGAGTGIGRATAGLFAAEGAKVVVTMRTEANGKKAVEEIRAAGGEVSYIVGDAGVREDCANMVAETQRIYGKLDILVHNAAFLAPGPVDTLSDDDLERAISAPERKRPPAHAGRVALADLENSLRRIFSAGPFRERDGDRVVGRRELGAGPVYFQTELCAVRPAWLFYPDTRRIWTRLGMAELCQ